MRKQTRTERTPIEQFRAERAWPNGVPMPKPGAWCGNHKWTNEEIELLRKHYPEFGSRYCGRLLGRTPEAVRIKADRMGIERQPYWTQEELDYLKQEYGRHGKRSSRKIAKEIGRTRLSVTMKAIELGLTTPPERWSDEEMRTLRELYGTMPLKELAATLGRSRTSVSATAAKHGLSTPHTPLTAEQEAVIRKQLGRLSMEHIAGSLGISVNRIRTFADRIGYRSPDERRGKRIPKAPPKAESRHLKEWTQEEIETLRTYYPTHGAAYVAALLGRAAKATAEKARGLGISASGLFNTWTREEEEYLRRECRPDDTRSTLQRIANHLGRDVESVYGKARRLKLLASIGTRRRR